MRVRSGVRVCLKGGSSLIVEVGMTGEMNRTRHGWESRTGEQVKTGAVAAADARCLIDAKVKLAVVGC
ncbi:MAG: hypothetical protein ACC669_04930 [bacterium]